MAKRKQIESAGGDPVANPDNAPQQGQTELPSVDSPSLSPATSDVANEPVAELPATLEAAPAISRTDIDNKEEPTDISSGARAQWPQLAASATALCHTCRFGCDCRCRRRAGRRDDDRRILQARFGRCCRP
jgi:hypothetical protein